MPNSNDRFTKLQVTGNSIKIVQEQTFVQNTFKVRGYTHAWLDDHTLLIMAANGDAQTKLSDQANADDMRILAEGTLTFLCQKGAKSIHSFRYPRPTTKKSGKLYYFYFARIKQAEVKSNLKLPDSSYQSST